MRSMRPNGFSRPRLPLLLALLCALTPWSTGAGQARPSDAPAQTVVRQFRITYVSSTTVYVDGGREDDLLAGDLLEVVRDGQVVATLLVADISSRRAGCAIRDTSVELAVGDVVRRSAASAQRAPAAPKTDTRVGADGVLAVDPPAPPLGAAGATGRATRELSWLRAAGIRGRLGARYLGVQDRSGLGEDISQPAIDLRLEGTRIAQSRFDMKADVRARRTTQTLSDGTQDRNGRTRVYRLFATYHVPGDHLHLTVGRQFSSALASVSTFDGVQAEYEAGHLGFGAFTGTQPEPVDYGYSTDIREHGLFFRLRSLPQGAVRWETVVAGIGSYQQGELNREYVAVLGQVSGLRGSLMVQQEIDFNRDWKLEAGESRQELTSTFASGRFRLVGGLDLDAGYDNRRNVRLYRDFVTPETEFDDTFRQGVWGGSTLRFAQRYRVGGSVRTNSGGSAGTSTSYSVTAAANQLTALRLQLRTRSTRYTNDRTEGWMHSLSGGLSLGSRWFAELFGGWRDEQGKAVNTPGSNATWYGANVDLGLGDSWYLSLSGERDERGDERYDQIYSSLSWRF